MKRLTRKAFLPALLITSTATLLLACGFTPLNERAAHITVHRNAPACDYSEVGRVSAYDGYERREGMSAEWSMSANEDRAMAKLREDAEALGGDALILNTRSVSKLHGEPSRIELNGRAITNCP